MIPNTIVKPTPGSHIPPIESHRIIMNRVTIVTQSGKDLNKIRSNINRRLSSGTGVTYKSTGG